VVAANAEPSFTSGVILAAGSARRMGQLKQLLPVAGKPMVQHVIDAAEQSRLDEIVLVLGHRADEIRQAVVLPAAARIVVNEHHATGQGGSLATGLRGCDERAGAAAILLGDQPGVTAALIDRVVAAFADQNTDARPILRPVYGAGHGSGERTPGHPVILARAVWEAAMNIEGDSGARSLIADDPLRVLELPLDGPPPADIDTPEAYRRHT